MENSRLNNIQRSIAAVIDNLETIRREAKNTGDLDRIRRKASDALDEAERIQREISLLRQSTR